MRFNRKVLFLTVSGLGVSLGLISFGLNGSGGSPRPSSAAAQEKLSPEYSPAVRNSESATNLYWGEVHLHTNHSSDAYARETRSVGPDEAFRFARGDAVAANNGLKAKLRRPYDFFAVADHGEYLGVNAGLARGESGLSSWPLGRRLMELIGRGEDEKAEQELAASRRNAGSRPPQEALLSLWRDLGRTADRYNEPGRFTALIAYEWSANTSGDNLHRVVLFRDDASKTTRQTPFSSIDSTKPEDLWTALEKYEKTTGGQVLAIPHNGNLSNGRMFSPKMSDGNPFTRSYAQARARWEPLVEVTQSKGDGEAHPTLSPNDEFADFERWDGGNIQGTAPKEPWMLRYEYARSVLAEGLGHEARLGSNPFKFGMIGSTDSHTGLSTATEDNYFGKFGNSEPSASRALANLSPYWPNWLLGASGITGAWARENTREAIFDAFKRREVYATTGSRIQVRLFGGWDYQELDVRRPDYVTIGYRKGVPMGGDLLRAASGKAPRFMVTAAKDPDEANLDRIQIIKGWLDAKGQTHEKIYDVALSDGRKVNPRTGKAPPVGNTVNVADASYTNSIGDPELATVWTDPDFDPAQRAFYYARVIEIPKPRWTAYDAKFYKVSMPKEVPMTVRDRAYTSPIWYTP